MSNVKPGRGGGTTLSHRKFLVVEVQAFMLAFISSLLSAVNVQSFCLLFVI